MQLEPIGMALYKRLFYHFSNLYHPRRSRDDLRFEKDYEDICNEWLGGWRPSGTAPRSCRPSSAGI